MARIARPQLSTKRLAISKANAQMVIAVSVASFVTVFCLIASNAVFTQNHYLLKVISKKNTANKQLDQNLQAFNSLVSSYKKFDSTNPNVLGGSTTGTGDNDGTNSKLILDALPSSYDFPALTSSLEKMLSDQSFKLSSITGVDDQLSQQNNVLAATPTATPIPFTFTIASANYDSINKAILKMEHSIRPMQIDNITVSGGGNDMTMTVTAHTYYQPGKSVEY